MKSAKARLTVVTQMIGAPSQRWISRQLNGFSRLDASVIAWQQPTEPDIHAAIDFMTSDPEPHAGPGRWLNRLRHVGDGNYFGAQGADRQQLRETLKRQNPDIVLCHFGHMGLRLLPVVDELSLPMVVHFHGMDLSSMLTRWFYRTSLERWGSRFSASVVVGSHHVDILRKYVGAEQPIHLIPCGVPCAQFNPQPRQTQSGLTLISVGRLVAQKGPQVSIRAFAQLAAQHPSAKLVLVGDGPDRPLLEALAGRLKLSGQIEFTGNLPEDEVRARLQDAHIFIHPSIHDTSGWVEGFGVAITEAAAMKLPVIASRSGGIPDQVIDGETGILVDPGDVDATAAAMQQLAGNPEQRIEMGERGRQRVARDFDTDQQIRKLETLLLELAGAGNSIPV